MFWLSLLVFTNYLFGVLWKYLTFLSPSRLLACSFFFWLLVNRISLFSFDCNLMIFNHGSHIRRFKPLECTKLLVIHTGCEFKNISNNSYYLSKRYNSYIYWTILQHLVIYLHRENSKPILIPYSSFDKYSLLRS